MTRFALQPLDNGRWRFVIEGPNRLISKPYANRHRAGNALWDFIMAMVDSPACRGKYTFLAEHVIRRRARPNRKPQQECL